MDSGSIKDLYNNIPIITRAFGTAIFLVTLATSLQISSPMPLILNWMMIYEKLNIWRLWTDYFYVGTFGFQWLFQMYLTLSFSTRLERNVVFATRERYGSYLYFLFLQMLLLDCLSGICYYPTGRPVLTPALTYGIIYYWSKIEPSAPVNLWGFNLTAQQFPFALLVLDLVTGQALFNSVAGIMSGHFYYFIKDVLPREKNIHLIRDTPDLFRSLTATLDFTGSPPNNRPPPSSTQSSSTSYLNGSRVSSLFSNLTRRNSNPSFPGRGYRLGGD